MPRPSAGELPSSAPISPYNTPPNGMASPLAPAIPLSYAGQPIPPAPAVKTAPTPAGLFNAFRRRWVLGTFVSLIAAAVVGAAIWFLLPGGKHEARALIDLRDKTSDGVTIRANEDYEGYRREQIYILSKTRDLLQRTVNDAAVAGLTSIKGTDDPVRLLEDNLSVSAAAPTILAVTLKGNNIEEMKVIVDTLVKKYVDDATAKDRLFRDEQVRRMEKTEQQMKDEIEQLQRRISLLTSGTGVGGAMTSEERQAALQRTIADIAVDISKTEKDQIRLKAERSTFQKELDSKRPTLDPDTLKLAIETNPAVVQLQTHRNTLAARLKKNTEDAANPATDSVVAETKEALTAAEAALEAKKKEVGAAIEQIEISKALSNLNIQVATLDRKIATNSDVIAALKGTQELLSKSARGQAEGQADYQSLRDSMKPLQELLGRIQTQLVEFRVARDLAVRTKVREPAVGMPNNNLNKKLILAGGGAFGTFGIVVLLIAFLEWRTRRVDGVDQVVTELGMRIIGTVPAFPNRASLKAATEAGGANWRFALNESINSTRTMLLHSARTQSMQVVMVTSATQGEGKTSLSSQLASSMATAGMRTLVVDCDLRNPSIHKLFELTVGPGVSEILTQDVDVADVIQPTAVPNLWVIPAGTCSNRVIAALAQGHPLETLFNRLRGQFDFIIVDSCPVLPVADALLIGQHVDGVVFSIMQDISQLPKVLLASEKLSQLSIPFLGAVVNGIKQDLYSYGYNYVKQLPA